jgi:hypothetical protein
MLYQMHDPTFDEQLRRAAIYVPSRKTLFQMFQAPSLTPESPSKRTSRAGETEEGGSTRTAALIDSFLDTLPTQQHNAPRIVDATVDYMAYLMQMETGTTASASPRMWDRTISTTSSSRTKDASTWKTFQPGKRHTPHRNRKPTWATAF